MPALTATALRKSFGPQVVLDDATFTLARGEKVGLIGANGAGKSTIAKILAGEEVPDGGSVSFRRGLSVRYLSQEPQLDPNKSAREAVEDALGAWRDAMNAHAEITKTLGQPHDDAEGDKLAHRQAELAETIEHLGGWDRSHVALDVLHRLGVRDVEAPCGPRSGGERRRIALAQLLVARPDVAILDEPTNHLDADTSQWLEDHLANDFPGAIVLVTHDRYFLDAIVDRILELERGKLTPYPGGYSDYVEKKAELMAHEERVEQNRQNILRREREWLSRGPKARSTKQKARINRAHALEAQGAATAGRPGEVSLVTAQTSRQGKTILELHDLALFAGERQLNVPFELHVSQGDRIGIVGPNGVGKTTLVRAILAAASGNFDGSPKIQGKIVVGKNTKPAVLDQARAGLDDTKSIFDDVRGENGGTVINLGVPGQESMDLRSYLELFLFDPNKQRQKVGALSGGERARVALAKVLRQGANFLLFDEPTNDLDLPTLSALEGMLVDYPGAVLVVTHDRAFLDRVATSILSFEVDATTGLARVEQHGGGWTDYAAHVKERRDAAQSKKREDAKKPAPSEAPKAKAKSALSYAEKIELDGLMDKIDAAETVVARLERSLADPSVYSSRGAEVATLQGKLDGARATAAALTARWELLESKRLG
ncbi:MAG: ABC-F family ATP-binding cassette domain-containing protein [Polyangiales bacterium]